MICNINPLVSIPAAVDFSEIKVKCEFGWQSFLKWIDGLTNNELICYGIILVLILILIIVLCSRPRRVHKNTSDSKSPKDFSATPAPAPGDPAIVVRRRTTSILKKQSLEDVVNNLEYKMIDCSMFCMDSAVKRIYVKNTCVKEIYDMYAEDLRNSARPKEDGCMVLGRWVLDESSHTYDISMETVVMPGDDAVFSEYELNFGGKIKLRVAEKLRKLRRDTNLQYDLTCWVHSHPGLGVFFSNSDSNVQMQLKHSQHPLFLVAFVVDILAPGQETGIFTFRQDGSINSKRDLNMLLSLEELHDWALESCKKSFSPDNYFNIMQSVAMSVSACKSIFLNSNAVFDISKITESVENGISGWAVGYMTDENNVMEYVISSIYGKGEQPSSGVMGCVVNVAHLSLPTIQRLITNEHLSVNFVLAYSTREATITAIPVVNGEIINDERFYGEVTIENLKIWTERKRLLQHC